MTKVYFRHTLTFIFVLLCSTIATAQISELQSDLGGSYYYTDHYEVTIDKPVADVWPHVLSMSKWMPWMANAVPASETVEEGMRVNLYGDFYIEVEKIIPERMIVLINLPVTDKGEQSQGIAMININEANGKTQVSIFMSRIYNWFEASENSQRKTRESTEFSAQRKATFQNNFLAKLKQLAEQ